MLKQSCILVIAIQLTACNLSNKSDSIDDQKQLQGSDPNGETLTIESHSGYHAIKVNDNDWVEIRDQTELSQLSLEDRIHIIELCRSNNYLERHLARSTIQYFEDINQTYDTAKIIKHCYFDKTTAGEIEVKKATIVNQQAPEGFIIIGGDSSGSTLSLESQINIASSSSHLDDHSLILIAKDANGNYYSYRNDNISYSDNDTLTVDFYSQNAEVLDFSETIQISPYKYQRTYWDSTQSLWVNLSYNEGSEHLIIPKKQRRNGDVYIEKWSRYSFSNGITFSYVSTNSVLQLQQDSFLDEHWSSIEHIKTSTEDHLYGEMILPNFSLFKEANFYTIQTIQSYPEMLFQTADYTQQGNSKISSTVVDLGNLPNVPTEFDLSLSELRGTILYFESTLGRDGKHLEIQSYFPAKE